MIILRLMSSKRKCSVNQPLVKSARANDDDDESNIVGYTPPYMKIKIDLDFNSKVPKLSLFDKNVDGTVKNLIELRHIDNVQNYIKYLTKVRFIIEFSRVYVIKKYKCKWEKELWGTVKNVNSGVY